jgi:hypothetical protein
MSAVGAKSLTVAVLSVLLGASVAGAGPTVSVQPATTSVLPGETFSVAVAISNASDAYAFQFDVTYDATLLKLTSVTNGGFLPDTRFSSGIAGASGSVTFVYDLLTGPVPGVSGGGTLATLTFETFADRFGTGAIHVGNVIVVDSKGADVAVAAVTGSASYRDVVAPTTTATATPGPNANGWNMANVTVSLHASDSGSGVKQIEYSLSGAAGGADVVFAAAADIPVTAEGISTLSYFATDNADNHETPQTLTVRIDRTPPMLTLPADITAEATSPGGAAVSFAASAFDALSGSLPVTLSAPSGSTFPLGTTLVSASATDLAGNTTARAFQVTVRDTRAPVFASLTATPNVLWPPNHKMVPVTVTASVADAVDPSPITRILSVSSNEAANGSGDGNTDADWQITGPMTVNLRAERAGNGAGRVYTITVESRDRFGNASLRPVTVAVPHNP